MSYVVGGGNTSAMHPAVFQNLQMRHQMMMRARIIVPPAPQVKEIVQEIAAATKSEELLQQFLEELQGLRQDFDEDRAERALREGPYSGIHRFLPANKAEWIAFLGFIATLVAIIVPMIINKPEPPTIIIQSRDREIVQQLNEINEHQKQEIEQLKQMNERLAEKEAQEDAKPRT